MIGEIRVLYKGKVVETYAEGTFGNEQAADTTIKARVRKGSASSELEAANYVIEKDTKVIRTQRYSVVKKLPVIQYELKEMEV